MKLLANGLFLTTVVAITTFFVSHAALAGDIIRIGPI
jgi:hypothetical protein